jgi:putative metallohydrolase (TIGR04338 family)
MRGPAPRDAQRARVYRAELPLPSSPLPGLDACAHFVDRVVGTLWWQARFPELTLDRAPHLRPGNGARTAFFSESDRGQFITLPRRYRTKGIVLHELAHWALHAQRDLPSHGSTFTRLVLDATEEFCGVDRAHMLADAYAAERVRVGEPPRRGPDGRWRYGCDERLRLGRGRRLTIRSVEPESPVSGVLETLERRGSVVVVRDRAATQRVAMASVWDVQPGR